MADPYTTAIPDSPLYAEAALAASTAYQQALAALNAKRSGTLRQYGYLGDIDSTSGTVKNVRVDPTNPYGALQSLLRSSALASEDARDAAEARGLHGGLAHKAESRVRYEHGRQSAALGSSLTSTLGGYQQEQDEATRARDAALYQAKLEALRRALEAQAFNPADVSDVVDPGYGNTDVVPDNTPAPPPATDPGLTLSPPPGTFGGMSAEEYNQHILDALGDTPKGNLIRTLVNPVTPAKPKAAPAPRYYTYKKDVPLRPGQKLAFRAGRGWYAAPK